ncbi:AAA family ATPase [Sphaerisporangium fuscum]|uniref:AAA family ATPase n=1 Tax=Sphaerisporangium fuscum TaxID=2835868 RepID=UPI0027E317AF|nr:AAA family ATPase [Sphaerisporangium fuscum]
MLLGHGEPVIVDASWTGAEGRAAAARVADGTASDLVALRCSAPPEVTAGRLAGRVGGISDAGRAVGEAMAAAAAPWPKAVEIDTGGAVERALDQALSALRPPEEPGPRRFRRPVIEPG